jgi:hypothetical protein
MAAGSDPSASVGRNKACALIVNTLQMNPELRAELQSCRSKFESGLSLAAHSTKSLEENEKGDEDIEYAPHGLRYD